MSQTQTIRELFLGIKPKQQVLTPAFLNGKSIEVRCMSLARRQALLLAATVDGKRDDALFGAMLLIETVYNPETGEPLFKAQDRDAVIALSTDGLDPIIEVALQVNGLIETTSVSAIGDEIKN